MQNCTVEIELSPLRIEMASPPTQTQHVIGDYVYSETDLLGRGSFSPVFRGHHGQQEDLEVAIKVIPKVTILAQDDDLAKEITILQELTSTTQAKDIGFYTNIIALFYVHQTPQHAYLVMEYCNGGDLADFLLNRASPLSEDLISVIATQLVTTVTALKIRSIVHR